MKIRTPFYLFKQGLIGLWRNRGMSLASISSVMVSLLVLGIIIILVMSLNNMADMGQSQFDHVQVFIDDDIEDQRIINKIGNDLESIDGIKKVEFESRDQAMENMKDRLGDRSYLLDSLQNNPFPNSYIIYFEDITESQEVIYSVEKIEEIDEIKYHQDVINNLIVISDFTRVAGIFLIGILGFVAMFIISNTIKITLNSRKQEVNIMKYVGATNWFIRWPFIIEGMLLGLIGSSLALVLIYYGYQELYYIIQTDFYAIFSSYIVTTDEMIGEIFYLFIGIGVTVGVLGSLISIRKYLSV